MGIFTTREIAIFIYAILLFIYIIFRKKGKSILMPVFKAACSVKLVIPFTIILAFSAIFIWMCTYLSFWKWIYVKDIILWTLFAGVPVCFNAVSMNLDEHYFKNIVIDNLKFAALVEFVTGTFTFHIIIEMLLQPLLVFFVLLQSSLVQKTDEIKVFVDKLVGAVGIIIFGFTMKSVAESIGNIQLIDIMVGLVLPIILSMLFLPVAYFFAVYSKYEILFIRMGFKEPDYKKIKIKHRIEIMKVCKLSYKKVCKFLYEYLPKIYVKMSTTEFEHIIDEFRGTTEHKYFLAIKHNGKYYVSRRFDDDFFKINSYTINKGGLFKTSNKELRKEIALQIQNETPFKNTDYVGEQIHYSVSLRNKFLFRKDAFFTRTKIAIFHSDTLEKRNDSIELPYVEGVKEQSDKNTIRLMRILKWDMFLLPFFTILIYFIVFLLASFMPNRVNINLDIVAFVFAIISQFRVIFSNSKLLFKSRFGRKWSCWKDDIFCSGIEELLIFMLSIFIAYIIQPININSSILSKLGIASIFSGVLIDICKRDQ